MAAPHVAGAIAAIRSACPSATADAIENALKSTGTPITDTRPAAARRPSRASASISPCRAWVVGTAPVVTQNPSNLTVTAGQQATFTAAATGTPTPTVIWQLSTNGGGHWDDIAWATSTTLTFTTVAAHNGYLFRAKFTNSAGTATTTIATLTVNAAPAAPVVTQNPSSLTVTAGQQATFTAAASGTPTPTVIWQVSTDGGASFNNIPSATSTTYSFTTAAADDGKRFRAVFTNSAGTATTTVATLTVNAAPVVTQNPSSLTVTAGQQATFTAAASGTPTPTVIWQVSTDGGASFNNIPSATSATYSFTTAAADDGKRFRAVFTNSAGTATTTIATLTVTTGPSAPVVTQNPSNLTVTAGQQATFTAAASGTPTPTVIWQVSTNGGATYNNISWATSTTLSFTTISSHNGYLFRAVFTNSVGTATTTAATLTVNPGGPVAPSITQNPSNLTVTAGQQATFTALANGEPTPTVIWQVSTNGGATYNNIGWATSTTLSFTTISSHNGFLFRAVFTNSAGTATTTVATLTVNPGGPVAPSITQNPSNRTVAAGQQASFTALANGDADADGDLAGQHGWWREFQQHPFGDVHHLQLHGGRIGQRPSLPCRVHQFGRHRNDHGRHPDGELAGWWRPPKRTCRCGAVARLVTMSAQHLAWARSARGAVHCPAGTEFVW